MSKVSVIVVIYNNIHWIKLCFDAIFAQTHQAEEVFAVICGNDDGSKEYLQRNYPEVKILDPGSNVGFAKGNNMAIAQSTGEFIQMVNPDLILESNYIEELLKVFNDPKVASATGKLLRYNLASNQKTNIIDSTGIVMSVSGRARDRGQNEVDNKQYDNQTDIFGVSGAAPMHRKAALEVVKFENEYFDEDFVAYWEDVDMSWRLNNKNYLSKYVPSAVGYHGRTAGQSEGGYAHIYKFIKHHKKLSPQILKWNYKNHILMYIKNARHIWHPAFVVREIAMLGYVLVFEARTLGVVPELFKKIPKILKKRKWQFK